MQIVLDSNQKRFTHMTLQNTSKIKQRPVTDGMTDAELQEYKKAVREEQYGNVGGSVWDPPFVFDASYRVEEKPLSDDLGYGRFNKEEYKRQKEEMEVLAGYQNKRKLIEKWKEYIEKMNNRIKQIQADNTLPVLTKQKKIQNCLNCIEEYKRSIEHAEKFLAQQSAINQAEYEQYMKSK